MFKSKKDDKVDVNKLNDLIKLGSNILKVLFVLAIICLILLLTFVLKEWNILNVLKTILVVISPFFIGFIIAWLFDPIVTFMNKKKIPRVVGTIIVYVCLLLLIYIFLKLMIPTLAHQINDFIKSVPTIVNSIKEFIDGIFDNIKSFDITTIKTNIFKNIEELGSNLANDLPTISVNILKSVFNGGVNIGLGLMVGFYMLFDFNNVRKHLLAFIPKKFHKDAISLTDKVNSSLRDFVQGTLFICVIVFVAQSIGLSIAGLKAPMLFAIFCAITNVIPYLGPYIGGIPAVIVGFSMSPLTGIFTLISIVAVQMIESTILQPIIMGKTMKLHPVTIMIGLLIFGYFFGIIGMIIAAPIISALKIIFTFIDEKFDIMGMIQQNDE